MKSRYAAAAIVAALPFFAIGFSSGCSAPKPNPSGGDAGTKLSNDAGTGSCTAPTSPFSALAALTAARCPALAWEADAFLVGIENGNGLGTDGNSQVWTVAFSSPSATCSGGTTTIGFVVDATRATVTNAGSSCLGTPKPLATPTVDSTTVVPAGVLKIMALAGGATVTYSADINSAASASGGTSGNWRVTGSWTTSGGSTALVEESYDPGSGSFLGATCLEGSCGGVDAGPADAGSVDAGLVDAGEVDAGTPDAGPMDAGPLDAGPMDAGPLDAGTPDAGPQGVCSDGATDAGGVGRVVNCLDGKVCNLLTQCVTPQYTPDTGMVTDDVTGLTWQEPWATDACPNDGNGACSWADAQTYCNNLSLNGAGWRMPTLPELYSLVVAGSVPTIDTTAFPSFSSGGYFWTSTLYNSGDAWFVPFSTGNPYYTYFSNYSYIRCVR